jgi:tRNA threonylcarbamoyladenosine biosynthesis protein TsaE
VTKDLVTVELPTVDDTKDFGRRLAAVLRAGDLLILDGPLGAGKTALAQGIAAGLGVRGAVTSPTFVIARVHQPDPQLGGRLPLVHVDAYRLSGMSEVNDLDLDTSLEDAVTVVEWGEGKVEQLSDAHLVVRLRRREDDSRAAELVGVGGDWPHRLQRLAVGS